MGPPPTGLLIETLLMTLNTVPAREVRTIVGPERLDHMRGFTIATLAPMNLEVFHSHSIDLEKLYYVLLGDEHQCGGSVRRQWSADMLSAIPSAPGY